MSYKDEYHPKIKSDLRKLDKQVVKEIYSIHLDNILAEPYNEESLYGDLAGVFSYHLRMNKVDYRIAYTVDEKRKVIYIVMIGKRENYYDILRRRLS